VTGLAIAPLIVTLLGSPDASGELPTLTLDAALAEVDVQSLTLVQARSRADESSGVVRQALAALLPTASAGVTYVRNSDQANFTLPPQLGGMRVDIQPLESTTLTGSLRVPLIVPNAWFDLAAARDSSQAVRLSAEATRLAVRTSLAQTAYVAMAAEEQVAASERGVVSADELVRSAQRRVSAGMAAPLEITRAQAELVKRQSDLAGTRAALERTRLAVGILLGRERAVRVVVPEVEGAPNPELGAPGEELVSEALERRPEVAAQRAQQAAAEAGVRSAWGRLVPQLSASATVFQADTPLVSGKKEGWRATLDLSWQLYDGGYRYGKLHQAQAQVTGARAGVTAQQLAIREQVQDAQRDLSVAVEQLRLARAQLGLASDSAASIKRSFEAGVASSLDVIDANDRLYASDSGLALARARLAQARLALSLALGRDG
jgi:outer membrane protein TolC